MKYRIVRRIVFLSALVILSPLFLLQAQSAEQSKTLLVSFDGFRADYLSKAETPAFDEIIKDGLKAEGLIPVFPSKTFPNYWAIATGLYPENSGFISNNMYDSTLKSSFSIGNREAVEDPRWYGGEPIWNTAEKQGKQSGTMFWVGSEAPVQNMRPTHWKVYDGSMPDSSRIDSIMHWFTHTDPAKRIDFGTLYFSFTDTKGHRHGPDSPEVKKAIQRADALISYLIEQLALKNLKQSTNIIIVSDHGMAKVSKKRLIVLDDIIGDPDRLDIVEYGPAMMFNINAPGDSLEEAIFHQLSQDQTNYRVWKKSQIPDRFHLKDHPRVPDYLMLADIGYTIATKSYLARRKDHPSGGTHGFDNQDKLMHGIFVASGPMFKKGATLSTVENIHIYSLLCHLLDIEPADNDGSIKAFQSALKER